MSKEIENTIPVLPAKNLTASKAFYVKTLGLLTPGDRVWVNVPGKGYVGVGEVTRPVVRIDEFQVPGPGGQSVSITQMPLKGTGIVASLERADVPEHLVGVRWIKTVPRNAAIKEKGLFGNQNTVARPRDPKWTYTIERLRERFKLDVRTRTSVESIDRARPGQSRLAVAHRARRCRDAG